MGSPCMTVMSFAINVLLGLLFGCGLIVAGMSDPAKVLNFRCVRHMGRFSAFVLGGAVLTAFAGYRLVLARPAPRSLQTPPARDQDN